MSSEPGIRRNAPLFWSALARMSSPVLRGFIQNLHIYTYCHTRMLGNDSSGGNKNLRKSEQKCDLQSKSDATDAETRGSGQVAVGTVNPGRSLENDFVSAEWGESFFWRGLLCRNSIHRRLSLSRMTASAVWTSFLHLARKHKKSKQ